MTQKRLIPRWLSNWDTPTKISIGYPKKETATTTHSSSALATTSVCRTPVLKDFHFHLCYARDISSNIPCHNFRIKNSKPTTAHSMKILRALLFICTFHTGCLAFYFRPIGRPISTSKLIYHTSSLDEIDTRISFKAPTPPLLHLDDHNTFDDTKLNHMSNAIALRGGGCSDSTPALFGKVAASAAVETFLMYQFLAIRANQYPIVIRNTEI